MLHRVAQRSTELILKKEINYQKLKIETIDDFQIVALKILSVKLCASL